MQQRAACKLPLPTLHFSIRHPSLTLFHPSDCRAMSSFWVDACEHANSKSLQALLDAAHGSCGMTVIARRRCCSAVAVLTFDKQNFLL